MIKKFYIDSDDGILYDYGGYNGSSGEIRNLYYLELEDRIVIPAKEDQIIKPIKNSGGFYQITVKGTNSEQYPKELFKAYLSENVDTYRFNLTQDMFDETMTRISNYKFYNNHNLTSINFPDNIESIGDYSFSGCKNLQSVNFNKVKTIGSYSFNNCINLTDMDLSNIEYIGTYGFYLPDIFYNGTLNLTKLKNINKYGLYGFNNTHTINMPNIEYLYEYSIQNFKNLKKVKFGNKVKYVYRNFSGSANLEVIDFTDSESVPSLGSSYLFNDNNKYKVIVPENLYLEWKKANNWKNFFDRIFTKKPFIEEVSKISFLPSNIEKDISVSYRVIGTPEFSFNYDKNLYNISDITIGEDTFYFKLTCLDTSNELDSSIDLYLKDKDNPEMKTSKTINIKIYNSTPEFYYEVVNVSGAANNFIQQNSYYVNKDISDGQYAICRLSIIGNDINKILLECSQSSESGYDYGIISKIDTPLSLDINISDSTTLYKFNGLNGVRTVDLGVIPSGNHFFDVKYRKDGSGTSGTDTFKFKIIETA